MASMPELLERLAERERARFAAEREATARIRAAEGKTTLAAQDLMELRRAHEQELRVLRAQLEKRLRDTSYACRQDVHRAQSELGEAEALADQAQKRQRSAEECAAALAQKVAEMRAHVRRRADGAAVSLEGLQGAMEARVGRVALQTEARASHMATHTREVCALSKNAIENVAEELQDQMARAHVRAEGRVRFKELCQLAGTFSNYDMTKDAYYGVKDELIGLWHAQKVASPLSLTQLTQLPLKLGDTLSSATATAPPTPLRTLAPASPPPLMQAAEA